MVRVFCEVTDLAALWAARRLASRGLEVDIVTAPVLGSALRWEHRVSREGDASYRLDLGDGRVLSSDQLFGVLNRLSWVPTERFDRVAGADRDYAVQEMNALFLSWMHALAGPVVNRPTPQGLGGNWRDPSMWTSLAFQAGLPASSYRQSCAGDPMQNGSRGWSASVVTVFVVANRVVAPPIVPAEVRDGCLRLANNARNALLGIDFVPAIDRGLEWVAASPIPDLTRGGEPLIDALAEVLES